MPVTQHITATITVSGPEPVQIHAHGTGGSGSFINVRIGNALVYVHDQLAADCYAHAWLCDDAAGPTLFLSKTARPMVARGRFRSLSFSLLSSLGSARAKTGKTLCSPTWRATTCESASGGYRRSDEREYRS